VRAARKRGFKGNEHARRWAGQPVIEFYAEIRLVHIVAVLTSGALFALRGLLLALEHRWVLAVPVRILVYSVDTVLLTAALMLMTIVHQYPFVDAWLTVKVLLLVVYVVLGYLAFWRSRTRAERLGYWLVALLVYAFIFSVARAHHPLGFLAML
jgi:uncharacterized membrane protein SirB2